jgi:hypothetical protein
MTTIVPIPGRSKIIDEKLNISIPNSLRAVAPFLDEALHIIRLQR